MPRIRRLSILGLKVTVAASLVAWLLHSGTLDLGRLALFLERPELIVADLGFLGLAIALGAQRWRLLLRLADVRLTFARALQLHVTGLFFNIVIPGNIGGDVVRSVYVAREARPAQRPTIYVIAFVDRLVGVASLIVIALVVTLLGAGAAPATPQLRQLSGAVLVLAAATLVAPLLVLIAIRRSSQRLDRWSQGSTRVATLLGHLLAAARLVASRPAKLAVALALGVGVHLAGMTLFAILAAAIATQDVPVMSVARVYPLGMLTLIVPISYAGIGVGHVAFERLFAIVGLTGGATVFNVFLIGQMTPCLFGLLPYLALRRQAAPPSEAEVLAQQTAIAD